MTASNSLEAWERSWSLPAAVKFWEGINTGAQGHFEGDAWREDSLKENAPRERKKSLREEMDGEALAAGLAGPLGILMTQIGTTPKNLATLDSQK